jgi:hypothetical protein
MGRQKGTKAPLVAVIATVCLVVSMFAMLLARPGESPAIAAPQDSADSGGLLPTSPSASEPSDPAQPARSNPRVTGWMPYWATQSSLEAVGDNAELFEAVSPFWFQLVQAKTRAQVKPYRLNGGESRESVRDELRAMGIQVIPTIVDDSPPLFLAQRLKSPKQRSALVKQIVGVAVAEGYDGIDLDLENFAFKDGKDSWADTRPVWVSFVRELSKALKAQGKVLTVTTPPIYNRDYTPSSGYWVYDWESIAPYIHRLRIMTYDYSFDQAGPIGPLDWSKKVVEFATTVVPARKIEMGAAAYGRNWVTSVQGECPSDAQLSRTYLNMERAQSLAELRRATPQWDSAKGEATYSYALTYASGTKSCTVTRAVWFPTPQSLQVRMETAAQLGLGGVAIWSLNEVSKQGWEAIPPSAR